MPILEPGLPAIPCEYGCGAQVQIERDGTAVHVEGKAKYSFICHEYTAEHYSGDCPTGFSCDKCCDCFGCQFDSEAKERGIDVTYDPEKHAPTSIMVGDELAVDLVVNEMKARLED